MAKKKKIESEYEGIFRLASKTFGFVKLNAGTPKEEEIFVLAKDSLDAMNDDRVLVKITSDNAGENKKREGKIIKIIERDTERDNFMDPNDALHYGLIDEIIKNS